jgi:DNA-binding NtrC family response regulator
MTWGVCTLDECKVAHIEQVLGYVNGNKTRAARLLKINVKTLYNLRRKFGLLLSSPDNGNSEERGETWTEEHSD